MQLEFLLVSTLTLQVAASGMFPASRGRPSQAGAGDAAEQGWRRPRKMIIAVRTIMTHHKYHNYHRYHNYHSYHSCHKYHNYHNCHTCHYCYYCHNCHICVGRCGVRRAISCLQHGLNGDNFQKPAPDMLPGGPRRACTKFTEALFRTFVGEMARGLWQMLGVLLSFVPPNRDELHIHRLLAIYIYIYMYTHTSVSVFFAVCIYIYIYIEIHMYCYVCKDF